MYTRRHIYIYTKTRNNASLQQKNRLKRSSQHLKGCYQGEESKTTYIFYHCICYCYCFLTAVAAALAVELEVGPVAVLSTLAQN